ncbi:MAG: hypothetical protein AB8B82_01295 [Roseovarius sp.]
MTNQLAIVLGLIILTALGLDYYYADWTNTIFLGSKLNDLIEYLAFWR